MPKEIRFAVGSRDDLRSSVWRLWANKDELFLAARSSAGLAKISFHSSGTCRFATVSDAPRPAIERWTLQAPTEPGITPAFDIVVPTRVSGSAKVLLDRLPDAKKAVHFIEAPAAGTKTIMRILLTDPTFTEKRISKSAHNRQVTVLGPVQLLSKIAWVVAYLDNQTLAETEFVSNLINTTQINLSHGAELKEDIYCSLHSLEGQNPKMIVDIQLVTENLRVDEAPPSR